MTKPKAIEAFIDLKKIIGEKLLAVYQNPDFSIVLVFENNTEFRLDNVSGEYLKVKGAIRK